MERKRIAEATKGVGKPKVGGPFELVDQEGRKFTDEDLKGGYSLVCAPILSSRKTQKGLDVYHERGSKASSRRKIHTNHSCTSSGLFRLHALSRHLPRRTRQTLPHHRPRRHHPSALDLHLRLRIPDLPPRASPPHLHNLRPSTRHALRSKNLPRRISPGHHRPNRELAADKRRV